MFFEKSSNTNASTPSRVHSAAPSKSKLTYRSAPALGGDSLHPQPTHIPCTPSVNINTTHQIQNQINKYPLEQAALLPGPYHITNPHDNCKNPRSSNNTTPRLPLYIHRPINCQKTRCSSIGKALISTQKHNNNCQGTLINAKRNIKPARNTTYRTNNPFTILTIESPDNSDHTLLLCPIKQNAQSPLPSLLQLNHIGYAPQSPNIVTAPYRYRPYHTAVDRPLHAVLLVCSVPVPYRTVP